ncbi:MAG: LruC domain-containing protein [Flavobacteriales bacterium]|nr:LruC domain-containing protein [Flavobacteriales bacterium]
MKNIFFVIITAMLAVSCVKTNSDTTKVKTDISAIESFTSYSVPVKDGMTTIVTTGEDTLAVTSSQMMISVPKTADLKVKYTSEDIYSHFSYGEYWQYLSFEDTKKGDYDYNDIVLHARVRNDRILMNDGVFHYKHSVSVQPVALGSAVKISLGILYKKYATDANVSEAILVEDCRATLFNGVAYFPINTDKSTAAVRISSKLTKFFEIVNDSQEFPVVWFIEAGGVRLYAASTNFSSNTNMEMLNEDGYPYGISMTTKWDYPTEKCNITKAYPGFEKWLKTGKENDLLLAKNMNFCFPACPSKGSGLIDLWYWEY